jgi:hypothetical protein
VPSVGILTFHNAHNFGAVLQAWALVQTLERLGCSVKIINYQPAALEARHLRRGWKRYLPSLGRVRMRRFTSTELPLTERLLSVPEVMEHASRANYDYLVCGSDQVWLIDRFLGYDRAYFLDFDASVASKRISYAPSCGNLESFAHYAEPVRHALSQFHAISARDENTLNLVQSLGFTDVTHVVDPTLLADYEELTGKAEQGNYLAIVGPIDDSASTLAANTASRLGIEVVAVGTRSNVASRELPYASPAEWVGHIARARFVVTSLFHGTVLSIRFRRAFVSVGSASRGFKITDVLRRFSMPRRYLEPDGAGNYSLDSDLLEPDYQQSEPLIQAAVEHSREYLRRAING